MKGIALAINVPGLAYDGFSTREACEKQPGALWIHELILLAHEKGIPVSFGADLYSKIISGQEKAQDWLVIQEELNYTGNQLIQLGGIPGVFICLESPLFAYETYDKLREIFEKFQTVISFGTVERVYFPSFENEKIQELVPWDERKLMCMVTANRHSIAVEADYPSRALEYAKLYQLHDHRFSAIQYFKFDLNKMDLYGKAWPSTHGSECKDKIATIKNYKFNVCFENGSYPEYFTEKLIDCFVAGTIPLYLGEPAVQKRIPPECFIDVRKFKNWEELNQLIDTFQKADAEKMLHAGREFLRSEEGQKYTYQAFARRVFEACLKTF